MFRGTYYIPLSYYSKAYHQYTRLVEWNCNNWFISIIFQLKINRSVIKDHFFSLTSIQWYKKITKIQSIWIQNIQIVFSSWRRKVCVEKQKHYMKMSQLWSAIKCHGNVQNTVVDTHYIIYTLNTTSLHVCKKQAQISYHFYTNVIFLFYFENQLQSA